MHRKATLRITPAHGVENEDTERGVWMSSLSFRDITACLQLVLSLNIVKRYQSSEPLGKVNKLIT